MYAIFVQQIKMYLRMHDKDCNGRLLKGADMVYQLLQHPWKGSLSNILQRLMTEVENIHLGPRTTVCEVNFGIEDRWGKRMKVKRMTGRTETTKQKEYTYAWPISLHLARWGRHGLSLTWHICIVQCRGRFFGFVFFSFPVGQLSFTAHTLIRQLSCFLSRSQLCSANEETCQ